MSFHVARRVQSMGPYQILPTRVWLELDGRRNGNRQDLVVSIPPFLYYNSCTMSEDKTTDILANMNLNEATTTGAVANGKRVGAYSLWLVCTVCYNLYHCTVISLFHLDLSFICHSFIHSSVYESKLTKYFMILLFNNVRNNWIR